MRNILTKEQLNRHLKEYYESHHGHSDEDVWFDPPAANVRLFARSDRLITLKCHILTGEVSESVVPYTAV